MRLMAMPTLHFGAHRTTIAETALEVGWDLTGRDPSPLGLENAIAAIEDELARQHGSLVKGAAPGTRDATIRDIALAAGVPAARAHAPPGIPIDRDQGMRRSSRRNSRPG
jgi:hypothetical protein